MFTAQCNLLAQLSLLSRRVWQVSSPNDYYEATLALLTASGDDGRET